MNNKENYLVKFLSEKINVVLLILTIVFGVIMNILAVFFNLKRMGTFGGIAALFIAIPISIGIGRFSIKIRKEKKSLSRALISIVGLWYFIIIIAIILGSLAQPK